ncbi:MAG: FadR family transcriptional regulator [Chloroflexi bacterium]|nr:FadR family transcriptional regulator [Chloroflexota bacterium]
MPVQMLPRDPLTNRVIKSLQEMIWKGELAPGEFLPSQQELASQYGVGLSTIREAMKALSLLGLVEIQAGRGTRVLPDALKVLHNAAALRTSFDSVNPAEVYEARAVIEVTLTHMAAQRADADDIAAIAAALDEMRENLGDDRAFAQADMRFHLAVAQASKNQILAQLYHLTRSLLEEIIEEVNAVPGVKVRALKRQSDILEAIRAGDPERALAFAEQHMTDIGAYLGAPLTAQNG